MGNSTATFESQPFAEGRFRYAYMGTWQTPEKLGQKCVIKKRKDMCAWQATDLAIPVNIQEEAQKLARGFNEALRPTCSHPISFTEVKVHIVNRQPYSSGPRLNEYVTAEDFIPGNFVKWCNNYGFISQEAKTIAILMPAFMHWSWVHTRGQRMVADLQGVRRDDGYTLTDPAILSIDGTYGATDTGIEGMAMFFLHHECNSICNGLPKPTLWDLILNIPQSQRASCEQLLRQVMSATTYTFELQFQPHIRAAVIQTFRQVAQR